MKTVKSIQQNLVGKKIMYGSPGYLMEGRVDNVIKVGGSVEFEMSLKLDGKWDSGHVQKLSIANASKVAEGKTVSYCKPKAGCVEIYKK